MSDIFKLHLGEDFFFEGDEYDFSRAVQRELTWCNDSLTPKELDEAEHFAKYIFRRLFKPIDRKFWVEAPFEKEKKIQLSIKEFPIEELKISLNSDESMEIKRLEQKRHPNDNAVYISFDNYEYYINLRSATLTLIALMLDLVMFGGVASTVLALLGVNSRAFAHISSDNGEICVLIETCRQKGRIANNAVFKEIKGHACVNNNLSCKFKKGGNCIISDTDIDILFDTLVDKNVLSKSDGKFKYNL